MTTRLYLAGSLALGPPCPSVCKFWTPEATKSPADTTETTVTTGMTLIESDTTWKGSICVEAGYKAARRESSESRQARNSLKRALCVKLSSECTERNQLINQLWSDPPLHWFFKKNFSFQSQENKTRRLTLDCLFCVCFF